MKTEFENLQQNDAHSFEADTSADKQVVKIYCDEQLIAKKIKACLRSPDTAYRFAGDEFTLILLKC